MVSYSYRCRDHGAFDVVRTLGGAADELCPTCGQQALRVFTPPMVRRVGSRRAAALAVDERSSHEPDVVTSLPARPRTPPPARAVDPAVRLLPRP